MSEVAGLTSKTAIVMGGSISGLWTARVLSDHFEQVLLLERDQLPQGPELRSGTPQASHYHLLLQRGMQIMEELFPGMTQELIAAGASAFDPLGEAHVRLRARWCEQFASDQKLLGCSRLFLEAALRRRVRQIPNLRFIEGVEVIGLESSTSRDAVSGVHIRWRGDDTHPRGSESSFQAGLIVDALGRRSHSPEWLVELGFEAPEVSVVDSYLGYVTRRYRKPADGSDNWPILLLSASPPHNPHAGLVFPEENDTWVVMMAGFNKNYPPTDENGFMGFARSLGPEFYAVVQSAEPISKPHGYRGTETRWRHYEKLTRWPERYVVLGDAFFAFNPIYAQGMTIAALSAVALGKLLQRSHGELDGLARSSLQEIAKVGQGAWLLAIGADLEWPGTIGEADQSLAARFGRWYIDKVIEAIPSDRVLRVVFNDVNQLLQPTTILFTPAVMWRVLRYYLRQARKPPKNTFRAQRKRLPRVTGQPD